MSHRFTRRYSRTSVVHAVVIPCFAIAAALAAKCGGDGPGGGSDAASGGVAPAGASGASSQASPSDPTKFCAALLPQIQALIKLPLTVVSTDSGEYDYVSCANGNGDYRASVIISKDPDKAFTSAPKKGYEALPGFGDVARSSHSAYQWVDVMKGNTFCEAIVTIDDKDLLAGDWKQTGGKMCMAAFAQR